MKNEPHKFYCTKATPTKLSRQYRYRKLRHKLCLIMIRTSNTKPTYEADIGTKQTNLEVSEHIYFA